MQRTCTAEDSMQSRSSKSTHKVSHSGGGGMDGGGCAPDLTIFFELPPPKFNAVPYTYGATHPTPPHL